MPDRIGVVALAALREITPASTIGDEVGRVDEGGKVVSVRFGTTLPGYPGWVWTVSVTELEDDEPSVLEVELLPAEGALLAPDWVPWSERLAEWTAAQAAAGEPGDEDSDDGSDADLADLDASDEELDEDDDEDDEEPSVLHSGDLDGVDIDEADVSEPDVSELDGDSDGR